MNPFRATSRPTDRLSALAERLILAMATAQIELPEASPEALWTLAISVAGWWLKNRSIEVEDALKPYAALPLLFGVFDGVKSLPTFAATASYATDYMQLAQGGKRFAEVVNELGLAKLKAALGNPIFGRLQAQILAGFPAPSDLAEALRPPSKAAPSASVGTAVRAATGVGVHSAVALQEPAKTPEPVSKAAVSKETITFLKERYRDDTVKRILKG